MANFYYVTAVAPASVTVSGRRFNLASGDTRGPFSEIEINQIMAGPDRSRLVSTKTVTSDDQAPPTVKTTPVNGMGIVVDSDETEVATAIPAEGKSYEESQSAPSIDTPEKTNYSTTFSVEEPIAPPAQPEVVAEIPNQEDALITTQALPLDPEVLDPTEDIKSKTRTTRTRRARTSEK
jgi:hypothetical protein